jgi:hypothetical protein
MPFACSPRPSLLAPAAALVAMCLGPAAAAPAPAPIPAPAAAPAPVPAPASDPAVAVLVMEGHDRAHADYADACSNGANADDAGRAQFIERMRADKKSRLARALAEAARGFASESVQHEVQLGEWSQTYHLRMGCSEDSSSYSAMIEVRSKMSNMHELRVKYLVTIDDDVAGARRKLRLRSIVPLALRDQ